METGEAASSGEGEDADDDEMLYIRGASPIMPGGYSSPHHGFHEGSPGYMEGKIAYSLVFIIFLDMLIC